MMDLARHQLVVQEFPSWDRAWGYGVHLSRCARRKIVIRKLDGVWRVFLAPPEKAKPKEKARG